MENVSVKNLVKEIREGLKDQKGSSNKDEVRVMRAMLNDREYEVGIYDKDGQVGTMSPAREARDMIGSVISGATSIKREEAQQLADDYDFKKSESVNMINISKEFINTYAQTDRKLPLGGRQTYDTTLQMKHVDEKVKGTPKFNGYDENGNKKFETVDVVIPKHDEIKSNSSCPKWLK